jgi:hypothetical protein
MQQNCRNNSCHVGRRLLAKYDHHGWWKCRYCLEQIPVRPSMGMRRSLPSMAPRHTTAMDGGSADIAGANICPYILYISAPPSLAHCAIPYILYISAPPSLAHCAIPYILYIKKGPQADLFIDRFSSSQNRHRLLNLLYFAK